MAKFTITFPDNYSEDFSAPVAGRELMARFGAEHLAADGHPVCALLVNNELYSLARTIDMSATVAPVTDAMEEGANIYRRTLCFILSAAAASVYPDFRLQVGHSIAHSYYCALTAQDGVAAAADLKLLEAEMKRIIAADMPIRERFASYTEALEIFKGSGQRDTYKLISQLGRPRFPINSIEGFTDLHFLPLLPSTGLADVFELLTYNEGFILHFPPRSSPHHLDVFFDIPKLSEVYSKCRKWGKAIGVSSVGELNEVISSGRIKDFMEISEAFQERHFAAAADKIHEKSTVKAVMLAGPSSSGKTTSAKKLSIQLRVLGYAPVIISLDNYYRGKDATPIGEDGKPDLECLEALDVDLFNENLNALFEGKETELPLYDFKVGARKPHGVPLKMTERSILIVEGIHGLNDELTRDIAPDLKFSVYLSALTQLTLDDHNRVPTSDNRLLRRIVRDAQFRNKGAAGTIEMWAAVRRGERAHIFPFQNKADIVINTALDYEVPVLKVYAEPLLRAVKPTESEYAKASELLAFLQNFMPVSSSFVPGQSILREFIGESDFQY